MHIIEADGIWITAIVENRWVQAKVYQIPSNYGVNVDVLKGIPTAVIGFSVVFYRF